MYQDTPPREIERYNALLRALDPALRPRAAISLTQAVRALAEAGIRARHPSAGDEEVRVRLTARLYGQEAARRLFGTIPDDAV